MPSAAPAAPPPRAALAKRTVAFEPLPFLLTRKVFREIVSAALLGVVLFSFVLFLQRVGKLFELLVRSSAEAGTVAYLFLLILPPVLTFTVPVGALVGVLIALGRMSSDGEIIALRAAGVPSRRLLFPVTAFAIPALAVAGACSCWLTPLATRETYRVLNRLLAEQLTAEIQPRVFEEQFPNKVLYVDDVIAGPVVRWRRVFIADLTPPHERPQGGRELSDNPTITIAAEALAVPDPANNRIQLSSTGGATYEAGKAVTDYYATSFPRGDQALTAARPAEMRARAFSEMDTIPLFEEARSRADAAIEFHQRLALPVACLVLALLAVPLGVSSRKGGKSSAFVMSVGLAFLYYMGMISLIGLAKQGAITPLIAVWAPNAILGVLAVALLIRLEAPGDRDLIGAVRGFFVSASTRVGRAAGSHGSGARFFLLPQIIDAYVLSSFLYYFAVLLTGLVLMTEVFTFFELLSDIIRNRIPMPRVGSYLFFLAPKLIYDTTPVSVLVAVLVTFGVMAKNNEVTAMKACGVSLYRLALPALIASVFLSAGLFAFDYYIVPEANLKQDAIRNEIKGRPVQTYLRPDRKWIFGRGPWIYFYKYFDPGENVMVGVSVYELDPARFQLRRHIAAESARWEPSLRRWVFQNGWRRDLNGVRVTRFDNFEGQTATFDELNEPPGYFLKEVRQDKQMNFHQLGAYIRELQQSGFDTVKLQIQFHKKFAVPLFALIMAVISIPFSFIAGTRGAMAGVGVSLGIAIAYWAVSQLFEQVGNVAQLPAPLAAWSPDALFLLAGTYFLLRMRT